MKRPVLLLALAYVSWAAAFDATQGRQGPANTDLAAWEKQARNVTIIRDDGGIPHVYGKTDADAVFGVMYAQAEDDFNRVETNYLNSIGRLAEAEGEAEVSGVAGVDGVHGEAAGFGGGAGEGFEVHSRIYF